MDCPFCTDKQILERMIYKDSFVMAFPARTPIVPGHILICPTRHVLKIDELSNEELIAIKKLIVVIKEALKKSFNVQDFNVAWNEGAMAGQIVNHFHIHIVPRKDGDKGIYKYDPREFLYRPGLIGISPEKELLDVAKLIIANL